MLAVLAFHGQIPGFAGGFVGVDVFFVVSGYLITGLLLHEHERDGRISLGRFYARRAQRLLPASTLLIISTLAAVSIAAGPLELWQTARAAIAAIAAAAFAANMFFLGSDVGYFAEEGVPSPFLHFWSLAIEEQFYVVWPPLLVLAARASRRTAFRRNVAIVLILILGASFTMNVMATSATSKSTFYVLPYRAWELGAGALLATVAPSLRVPQLPGTIRTVGLALITYSVLAFDAAVPFPGWRGAVPVVGTLLVLHAGTASARGLLSRLLSSRAAQRVGRYSYSLYLWHWPVLTVLAMRRPGVLNRWFLSAAAVAAATPLAIAAYHAVEDPVRRSSSLRSRPRRALALGSVLVAVGVGASVLTLNAPALDAGRAAPADATFQRTTYVPSDLEPALKDADDDDSPLYEVARCDTDRRTPADRPCTFGDRRPPSHSSEIPMLRCGSPPSGPSLRSSTRVSR